MKHTAFLLMVGLLTTSFSGCAKIRQLTRRDYKSLQDPFMMDDDSSMSVASTSAAPTAGPPVESGFVQIPDTQSGRVPTRTVSATERGNTNFQGVQANGMGAVINQNSQAPTTTAGVPSAHRNSFVREMKNLQLGQPAAPKSDESSVDFAAWAAEQKKSFQQEAQQVVETAQPVINEVKQLGQLANQGIAEPLIQPVSSQQTAEPLILQPPGFSTAGLQKSVDNIRRDAQQIQSNAAAAFAEIESVATPSNGFSALAGAAAEVALPQFNPSEFELEIPNQSPVQRSQSVQHNPFASVNSGSVQNSTATQFIPSTPAASTAQRQNPFANANLSQPKATHFGFPQAQAPKPAVAVPPMRTQGATQADSAFSFDSGWQSSDIDQ